MKRLLLILVISVTGCAVQPPQVTPLMEQAWKTHQTTLSTLETWLLKGRIAIREGEENWVANVYWQQQASSYELRFNAALGQGALWLTGDNNRVILKTSDNRTYVARNPDELIAKVLKLAIPVTGLRFWIRGIPSTDSTLQDYHLNEAGYLFDLQQDGWTINYSSYRQAQNLTLPEKIYLENEKYKVKIIISEWEF